MDPQLRSRFNADFSAEKYAALYRNLLGLKEDNDDKDD